jgi:hypothetical protein
MGCGAGLWTGRICEPVRPRGPTVGRYTEQVFEWKRHAESVQNGPSSRQMGRGWGRGRVPAAASAHDCVEFGGRQETLGCASSADLVAGEYDGAFQSDQRGQAARVPFDKA